MNRRVHRKTLEPVFNETFEFACIPSAELQTRTVVFMVYDFDRFSRHDFIGTARVDLADTDLSAAPRSLALDLSPALAIHQVRMPFKHCIINHNFTILLWPRNRFSLKIYNVVLNE